MPLVSTIINVRNGAATLREAIESVLAQTFTEWELIIWDDRSSDASASIVAEYHGERVRYFLSPQDVSLGKARSDAIRQAKGEWIAFLDQDDIWLPGKLEKQMALADESVGLIYGRTIRFYPRGMERDYDQKHEYELLPEGNIFTQLFTKSCFIAMSSAVFRRSAIEAIGGIPTTFGSFPTTIFMWPSPTNTKCAQCSRPCAGTACTPTACPKWQLSKCIRRCCGWSTTGPPASIRTSLPAAGSAIRPPSHWRKWEACGRCAAAWSGCSRKAR
jgi:hypothetical protein